MKKRFKKVIPFIFAATVCLFLGGLRVCALPLCQTNGQPVTDVGQMVEFVGTNGFAGEEETSVNHQAGLMYDEWMVMKIEGNQALIMKKNPIAVQHYRSEGDEGEARYNESAIKVSVDAWWAYVKDTLLSSGKAAEEYVLPVILQGADQSDPDDQTRYRTVVDVTGGGTKQAFVPSFADVTDAEGRFEVLELWDNFIGPFSANDDDDASCFSWLRSPLDCRNDAAVIYDNYEYIQGVDVRNGLCAVRPACWVRI